MKEVKFGLSETDLFAEAPDTYILETKLFRKTASLGEVAIKNSLVQLQSYMDQSPKAPRGVLIVYNLTSSLLLAPRQWIQGRYWVLPINLQEAPPSGRKRSLSVEPGKGQQLIEVIVMEHQPKAKKGAKNRRKKKATRKRR